MSREDEGILYETIEFRGPNVVISFTEEYDRGDGVARVQTLIVDSTREEVAAQYAEFVEALTALVRAGQLKLRNPPQSFR